MSKARILSNLSGSVLQVVTGTQGTRAESTSTSYATTNLSQAITPKISGSKVLITISIPFTSVRDGNSFANMFKPRLLKDGSVLVDLVGGSSNTAYGIEQNSDDNNQSGGLISIFNYSYMDTTTGTSAITYSVDFASRIVTEGKLVVNGIGNPVNSHQVNVASTITLTEVAV